MNEQMLLLLALDDEHCLMFSEYSGQWYVGGGHVEIGGDGFLSSPVFHEDTPDRAIDSYLRYLQNLPTDRYIQISYGRDKPEKYRWNGVAWKKIN